MADFTNSSWTGKESSTSVSNYSAAAEFGALYRAHVDEELPEGLLASPSIHIPKGVIHGGRREMNDTLLGTNPATPGVEGPSEK